jgi:hypothetical protein
MFATRSAIACEDPRAVACAEKLAEPVGRGLHALAIGVGDLSGGSVEHAGGRGERDACLLRDVVQGRRALHR